MNKRPKLVIHRDTLRLLDAATAQGVRAAGTLTQEGGCNSQVGCGGGGGGSTLECTQRLG